MPSGVKFLQFGHGACQPQAQKALFFLGIQWEILCVLYRNDSFISFEFRSVFLLYLPAITIAESCFCLYFSSGLRNLLFYFFFKQRGGAGILKDPDPHSALILIGSLDTIKINRKANLQNIRCQSRSFSPL